MGSDGGLLPLAFAAICSSSILCFIYNKTSEIVSILGPAFYQFLFFYFMYFFLLLHSM